MEVEFTVNGIKGGKAGQLYKGTDRDAAERTFREALLQHDKFDAAQKLDSEGNDFRQDTTKPRPAKAAAKPATPAQSK